MAKILNYTQAAIRMQNNCRLFLQQGYFNGNAGLCSALTNYDNNQDVYDYWHPTFDYYPIMRYLLGDNLYSFCQTETMGECGEFSNRRKAFCEHISKCSIRTIRRYIGEAQKNVESYNPQWHDEPIRAFAFLLKIKN